jgi:hypothetical protein
VGAGALARGWTLDHVTKEQVSPKREEPTYARMIADAIGWYDPRYDHDKDRRQPPCRTC